MSAPRTPAASRPLLGPCARALVVGVTTWVLACGNPPPRPVSGDDVPTAFVGQARLRAIHEERDGFLVSPLLEAPKLASRVGAWWSVSLEHSDDDLHLEVRGWREDGSTTAWLPILETWSDPVLGRIQRVGRVDFDTFVVGAELRLPTTEADRLAGLVWSAVIPDDDGLRIQPDSARLAPDPGRVGAPPRDGFGDGRTPSLGQALAIAGIEPRSAWNAMDTRCSSLNQSKARISVHHSVTALNATGSRETHAAAVRGTQAFHMSTHGWCDIGYHFATTADGTVWEGREAKFVGAHVGGHNTNNAGIVFLGCFHPTSDCNGLGSVTPPQAMLDGGGTAIGNIARHYGIPINSTNVVGHRDNPDQTTSCPGNNLHGQLQTLRSIAQDGVGSPPLASATGSLRGTVWDLAVTPDAAQALALGAHLPGAVVRVTDGPSTTASADTAIWSLDLPPGTYTVTASHAGFAPASREVQVMSGTDTWASIGLAPAADAVDLTVRVRDATSARAISRASVTVTGVDPAQSNGSGEARFSVTAGSVDITVTAEGYVERSLAETLTAGEPVTVTVDLERDAAEGPGAGDHDLGAGVKRVTILPPPDTAGGCRGAGPTGGLEGALLALTGWLFVARRRRAAPR